MCDSTLFASATLIVDRRLRFSVSRRMSKMSFREPFNFPYVTTNIPRWSPTSSVVHESEDEYVLKPGEDASKILNSFSVVKLQHGATYRWHDVDITKPVKIIGNGAVIKCPAVSYCLKIKSPGVSISECIFVGKRPSRSDAYLDENKYFAVWLDNVGSSCITSCSFVDFSGGSLFICDDGSTKSGSHVVDRCIFRGCKAAVILLSVGGDLVCGGLLSSCYFDDCMYGVYAVSMFGWRIRDCLFDKCSSGVFHIKRSSMAYGSMNNIGAGRQALDGFGLVTGCLFRSCLDSNWPGSGIVKPNTQLDLGGFYFDDENSVPIRVSDCHFIDSELCLGKKVDNPKIGRCFITGCLFWYIGTDNNSDFDVITRLDAVGSRSDGEPDIYFSACSGRIGCEVRGLKKENFEDSSFIISDESESMHVECANKSRTT